MSEISMIIKSILKFNNSFELTEETGNFPTEKIEFTFKPENTPPETFYLIRNGIVKLVGGNKFSGTYYKYTSDLYTHVKVVYSDQENTIEIASELKTSLGKFLKKENPEAINKTELGHILYLFF